MVCGMRISDVQIGLNVRGARSRRGMTQADIAEALDLPAPATISEIESGKRALKLREAQALAELLNIDLRQLVDES